MAGLLGNPMYIGLVPKAGNLKTMVAGQGGLGKEFVRVAKKAAIFIIDACRHIYFERTPADEGKTGSVLLSGGLVFGLFFRQAGDNPEVVRQYRPSNP